MSWKRLKASATPIVIVAGMMVGASPATARPAPMSAEVVVYGCTPAGITAAMEAKALGRSVLLVCREGYVGGMSTNGLGWADTGNHGAIGGMAKQFYRDVKAYYLAKGVTVDFVSQTEARPDEKDTLWVFEPHVAEAIYERWLKGAKIQTLRSAPLRRDGAGVIKSGAAIRGLRLLNGRTVTGKVFIDATYEGDLMAEAGVSFTTGREANAVYGETLNGVQAANATHHQFDLKVDPYVRPGDPSSGLLPRIEPGTDEPDGAGDKRVQAYAFRLCMTKDAKNRAAIPKPDGYDARQYELLGRYLDAGWRDLFSKYDPIPGGKTDTNNHGAFSFDNIGMNYGYPTGDYAERARIVAEHRAYQAGLLWFMQNDPRAPADVRQAMKPWGLCADEFVANGHWPRELYVREGRRMVSSFVMTERHLRGLAATPHSVGLGSYTMDSHNVRRYVGKDGFAHNEGDVQVPAGRDYEISYDSLVPRRAQATNLIVPVALSASHIAYGSIRMEPVFMILGQSAGAAASLSVVDRVPVQAVDYQKLRARLLKVGQVIAPR